MALLTGPMPEPVTGRDEAELLSLRADVDALSEELLNRYEEMALLYDLSRELGVVTDLGSSSRTALARTLQVIPGLWGTVVVGSQVEDMVAVASAGSDPEGRYAAVARRAAAAAIRQVSLVMVDAGGVVDDNVETPDPVLAVPLRSGQEGDGASGAAGVLVLVGHSFDDRFSAGDAQLAAAVARQLSVGVENARIVVQLREKEGFDRELAVAASIQRSLLPAAAPTLPNATLAAACLPAAHVGGDYYDFVTDDAGTVQAVVADVSGHGLGPGLIMAMTRIALRAELGSRQSLASGIAATNGVMWDDLLATGVFITLFALRYDPRTRAVSYVNGGHHPALLRHPDGSIEELTCAGMPLGLVPEASYDEAALVLAPGACVVIFSDGIVEARAHDQTMYGSPRLRELVREAPTGSAENLVAAILLDLKTFLAGSAQDDDVTVVVLQVAP